MIEGQMMVEQALRNIHGPKLEQYDPVEGETATVKMSRRLRSYVPLRAQVARWRR